MIDMQEGNIPPQTPLFWAINSNRYYRQDWIAEIESLTNRELIVYVADPIAGTGINEDDIPPFVDLLNMVESSKVDLLLNSNGGMIDSAEKILYMCREKSSSFRVIIPERAKSAATLIALGSDEIVMGIASELGPTDPQIMFRGTYVPAHSILNGLKDLVNTVKGEPSLFVPYAPLIDQLNVGLLNMCERAIESSKNFVKKWLERHMLRDRKELAEQIAEQLSGEEFLLHSEVIDAKKAKEMGLTVKELQEKDPLWQKIWRLYCIYLTDMRNQGLMKIFESKHVSIPLAR